MGELVKALGRFVSRDLIFVIGGGADVLSFLYLFNRLPSPCLPAAYYVLGAGLAYVVGYAIQDLSCIIGLSTMADYFEPNRFVRWLYRRFTAESWSDIPSFDTIVAQREVYANQTAAELLERVTSLRQVGTTMGPCALISSACLLTRALSSGQLHWRCFDIGLAVAAAVLGVGLVCLGWLKGAQQVRWLQALQSQGSVS